MPGPSPVRLSGAVRLTKQEAFAACQVLADADRFLLRAGHREAAGALGDLFELLEERLAVPASEPGSAPDPAVAVQASSGSKSSERELTQ